MKPVKDMTVGELAAFFHWQDRQSLAQAVLVAQSKEIDLNEVERWSRSEGKLREFRKIRKQLVGDKSSRK